MTAKEVSNVEEPQILQHTASTSDENMVRDDLSNESLNSVEINTFFKFSLANQVI